MRRWLLLLACLTLGCRVGPNVVVVLVDDMHTEALPYLPYVDGQLRPRSVEFVNAVISTPICCPSRTSLLTGQYAHHHGVRHNGGIAYFDATASLGTWLQAAGYQTGFFGKYLLGYDDAHVPPGWARWVAFQGGYTNYTLVEDGIEVPSLPEEYSTDVLRDHVLDFIDQHPQDSLFILYTPFAPHAVAEPAPRHRGIYANEPNWRPPNWGEVDVSDKPSFIRIMPRRDPSQTYPQDDALRAELESLLAVDEAVAAIRQRLAAYGVLDQTLFIFASDQGISRGAHRWYSKMVPYEESIRTTLLASYPPLTDRCHPNGCVDTHLILATCDTTATILDLTPATSTRVPFNGVSYRQQLAGEMPVAPREAVLLEYFTPYVVWPYTGVREASRWKYIRYDNAFEELYDLNHDPWEMDNLVRTDPESAAVQAHLVRLRERTIQLQSE